jgi:hypothetical protein
MRRRLLILASGGLLVGWLGAVGLAGQADQYPGSVRVSRTYWDFDLLSRGMLGQESTYLTKASFSDVQAWYVQRLRLVPTAKQHLAAGCAAFGKPQSIIWITHREHVLICDVEQGTRVQVRHTYAISR